MNGLDTYYNKSRTVGDCWNDAITISPYQTEGLTYEELIEKMCIVFTQFLQKSNLAKGKEKWIKDYVIDSIQESD